MDSFDERFEEEHKEKRSEFEPSKFPKFADMVNKIIEEESVFEKKSISFLGGRPDRDTIIGLDDILNLVIAMNDSLTFEEFFLQV